MSDSLSGMVSATQSQADYHMASSESLIEVQMKKEQKELFNEFYNREKELIKDMDRAQLREHRDELIQNLQDALEDCGIFEDDVFEILNRPKQITH